MAAIAFDVDVRAIEHEVRRRMIEVCPVQLNTIEIAAFVVAMAVAAGLRASLKAVPVITFLIVTIRRHLLVAVEAETVLRRA